ncbi:MAG: NADP-dependent isocitrate dehydrogenase [Bacteroidota bacterium]
MQKIPVTVAYGDGIGPEIMEATLRIMEAAGAQLDTEVVEIGEKVYRSGHTSGIKPEAWDSLRRTKVFLKAPITTPQGGGYKSLNVTVRKTMGLFANIRPCRALHPFVPSKHPLMDLVVIRENEEDLYAGIEHQQTTDVTQCLKLITRPGCERIVRYAFEYARTYGRKKVTCMIKDNIMKITDGLFHSVFKEIGQEYPDIEQESKIIDIGSALLADRPQNFDVVVTTNLYGDVISDITAQIAGSVGLAGSSNIGEHLAMFEAIHGSAPDIAGQGIANPSGLLNGALLMLAHIGQGDIADKIQNAWLRTLEDGIHTGDIYEEGVSQERVGTQGFADAVIARLDQAPQTLKANSFAGSKPIAIPGYEREKKEKTLVGCDVFVDWQGDSADEIGQKLESLTGPDIKLKMITNRGVKVYPNGFPETFCTDHWRCRFISAKAEKLDDGWKYPVLNFKQVLELQNRLNDGQVDVIKTENLYEFDGERAFSLGQGE